MALKEEFEQYVEKARILPESSNENKLILYSLYKQATVGKDAKYPPVRESESWGRSRIFNMKDRAMRDAWKSVEEKSEEEAMTDCITKPIQMPIQR